jgi:hypothetical protein
MNGDSLFRNLKADKVAPYHALKFTLGVDFEPQIARG